MDPAVLSVYAWLARVSQVALLTLALCPLQMGKANYHFKCVIVGNPGVGKTNLMTRFTKGEFSKQAKSTVGVEFSTRQIDHDGLTIEAQVWDTAGQERLLLLSTATLWVR